MTSKDKTAVANVVRKFPVVSKELESSTANELSDGQVLIQTASGVCITAVGLKSEDAVRCSDTLHSYRL